MNFRIKQSATPRFSFLLLSVSTLIVASLSSSISWSQAGENQQSEQDSLSVFLTDYNMEIESTSAKIHRRDFDSWEPIDDFHLLIKSKRDKAQHLVTFSHRCRNLDNHVAITTKTDSSYITKFDLIYVTDQSDITDLNSNGTPRRLRQTCSIDSIAKLQSLDQEKT